MILIVLIVFDFELVNLLCEHTNCFTCWQFFVLSCDWQRAEITLTFYNTLKFHTWQLIYTEVRENVYVSVCVRVREREREKENTLACTYAAPQQLTDCTHTGATSDRHGREVRDPEGGQNKPKSWSDRSVWLFFCYSLWLRFLSSWQKKKFL